MKNNFINSFNTSLSESKNELCAFVKKQISEIEVKNEEVLSQPIKEINEPRKSLLPKICLVGGVSAVLLGMLLDKNVISVGGCAFLVSGLYLKTKQKKPIATDEVVVDYSTLSNNIYNKIEEIHLYVSNEWDVFLGKNKQLLRQEIEALNIDSDEKTKMRDMLMSRSVICFSMMSVFSTLNQIKRNQNIEEYKQYLVSFEKEYLEVIEAAYREQQETYNMILNVYMK